MCVRSLPYSLPFNAPKATYFRHFKTLARKHQGPAPVTEAMRKVGEAAYDRGCERMTATAEPDTFDRLLKLHNGIKCAPYPLAPVPCVRYLLQINGQEWFA